MALVVTFRLPVETCAALIPGYGTPIMEGLTLKAAVKNLVAIALASDLSPMEIHIPATVQTERVNLSFKEGEAAQLRALAKEAGSPESIICQRLLVALAKSMAQLGGAAVQERLPDGCEMLQEMWELFPDMSPRVAQAQVFVNLKAAFSDGEVALIEAATGVGKTLAALVATEQALRQVPDTRIVIAVPTLSVMRQYAVAHRKLVKAGFPISPLRAIIGRREFVSKGVLEGIKNEPKYFQFRETLVSWMNQGGLPSEADFLDKPWLVATLQRLVPGFPAEACALPDAPDDDDPGYLAYQDQFVHEDHPSREILLCTHAMLSISTKLRHWGAFRDEKYKELRSSEVALMMEIKGEKDSELKKALQEKLQEMQAERLAYGAEVTENMGKLPPFRYLLVDEAHQLEAAMSSANSSYLSIRDILSKAEACHAAGLGVSSKKLDQIRSAVKHIQSASESSKGEMVSLGDGDNRASVIAREGLTELLDACSIRQTKEANPKQQSLLRQLAFAKIILRTALENRSMATKAFLKFSPVREYPQLFVGAKRVDGLLSDLWGSVKAAACLSATLYVPRTNGEFSGYYQRKILSIPNGRGKDFPPIVPRWTYQAVTTLEMPPKENPILPPSRSDKLSVETLPLAEADWLSQVAKKIAQCHQSAVGGTLVLMTSYASITKLLSLLPEELQRICIQGSLKSSLSDQSKAFLTLAVDGRKPIWLATGAAWTGLDIGGHDPLEYYLGRPALPAMEDNILTDLIIPRLPFGINRSITHEYRVRNDPNTPWEIFDMLFRLKQGIGRLIRRENLPENRRIFLLDSRIWKNEFSMIRGKIELLLMLVSSQG